jgi:hypothetical protein
MDNPQSGGAIMKFKIHLAKIKPISEISINPFCTFPMEVISIKINNYEVIGDRKQTNASVDTMTFNFNEVNTDSIEITIRQKSYTYISEEKNDKYIMAESLFREALGETYFSYINSSATYKDLFEQEMSIDITEWNKQCIITAEDGGS